MLARIGGLEWPQEPYSPPSSEACPSSLPILIPNREHGTVSHRNAGGVSVSLCIGKT
jgi:hypothetical protein